MVPVNLRWNCVDPDPRNRVLQSRKTCQLLNGGLFLRDSRMARHTLRRRRESHMLTGIRIRTALCTSVHDEFCGYKEWLFRRVLRKKRKPNQHQRNETRHL